MNEETIVWTRPKLEKFKVAFEKAFVDCNRDLDAVFKFEHNTFVIAYARYLISRLERKL